MANLDPLTTIGWAEGLILQLPHTHDGRNSWLINHGRSPEAQGLRAAWEEQNGRKCTLPRDDVPKMPSINAVYSEPEKEGQFTPLVPLKIHAIDREDDGSYTVILQEFPENFARLLGSNANAQRTSTPT